VRGSSAISLKVVFLPLLAFQAVILIDNFRSFSILSLIVVFAMSFCWSPHPDSFVFFSVRLNLVCV